MTEIDEVDNEIARALCSRQMRGRSTVFCSLGQAPLIVFAASTEAFSASVRVPLLNLPRNMTTIKRYTIEYMGASTLYLPVTSLATQPAPPQQK